MRPLSGLPWAAGRSRVDGITAIQQRIAAIQSRIAELEPRPRAVASTDGSSFGAVLASYQVSDLGTVGQAAGVVTGADAVNSDGVPLALVGYGNGRIPDSALSPIAGTSHELWAPAARSFEAMRAAAAADGVTIGITDSYRSYDAQVDVAARKGLYNQGGLAATPGTSMHGWGVALDLKLDDKGLAWMREHGKEYAFVESTPRESWHWEYQPRG